MARASRRARPVERYVVEVDGETVDVCAKAVKNVSLRLRPPHGTLEMSVPFGTPDGRVRDLVRSKMPWVLRQRARMEDSPMARAEGASPVEVAAWREVVSACAPALVEAWEPIMGVKAGELAFRNMKSRWGSCQPATGRICLNVRLALYPPECLEYVVVHELCHLLERGHGPRFQRLMDGFMPDWKQRRAKLR